MFSDVVPGTEGFLVTVDYRSPGLLSWMLERVAERGLTVQRFHLDPDTSWVIPVVERLDAQPPVVAWLVPRRLGDDALRTVPGRGCRGFAAQLDRDAPPVLPSLACAHGGPVYSSMVAHRR